MSMNHQKILIAILGIGASLLFAPATTAPQSLGEIARELRREREAQPQKAAKVYTNDNIAKSAQPETILSPTAEPNASEAESGGTEASPPPQAQEQEAKKTVKSKDYWEARFHSARAALARAKEEQQLVEDELSLLEIQQVRSLDPDLSKKLSEQIGAKKDELEIKRTATRKAQKTLDELNKEFEESGAPEDWRGGNGPR
jgi:hypothetical protein